MKQALHVLKEIIVWLFVAFAIGVTIFTFVSTRTFGHMERDIFGFKAFVVLSDSMSATDFDAGDVVFVKAVDPSTLQPGDIISYSSQDPDIYGETVTHKIRSLTQSENGEPGFITYGTTTDTDDKIVVTHEFVIGKYQFAIPKIGTFFQFLKTTPGYILFILIPFALLILYNAINCFNLFRRYKKEQMEEVEEERKKLAEEREEHQKLMKELQDLKSKLASENTPSEPAPSTPAV